MIPYSRPYLDLIVMSQLAEPLKRVDVITAGLEQFINNVPSVNLHRDQSYDLQTQDFGQVITNHLWINLENGDLTRADVANVQWLTQDPKHQP